VTDGTNAIVSRPLRSGLPSVSNSREVWLITAAHAVNEFYSVALPPILPLLVSDFAISYGEAGALLTVFFLTYSVFQLPAGALADRVGQRWILGAGMVVLSAGMLVAAGAGDYATLVVAETVAGLGGSSYHPAGMSLISDLEGGATEGTAMGIHGLGGVVGTALAPALIGGLAALSGWRVALALGAVVGVVYAAVFLVLFRDVPGGGSAGTVRTDGRPDPTADGSALGSLVSVPRERWVGVLFLANLTIATELGAVRTFVTSYLVEHAGVSTGVANAVFFLMLVGAGVSSLGAGALADSTDRRILGAGAMAASTVVLAATALVPSVPLALLGWFLVVGAVTWAALPAMNAITSRYSERRFSGSLFGVMLTAGSLGGAGGPLLFGVVAERLGMGTAFPVIGAVSAFGAVVFLAMGRPPGAADRSAG